MLHYKPVEYVDIINVVIYNFIMQKLGGEQ